MFICSIQDKTMTMTETQDTKPTSLPANNRQELAFGGFYKLQAQTTVSQAQSVDCDKKNRDTNKIKIS